MSIDSIAPEQDFPEHVPEVSHVWETGSIFPAGYLPPPCTSRATLT
ncbi:MAG: hypothetical protein RID09_21535 [Coleofasciculus sp. G1-WW12-02]